MTVYGGRLGDTGNLSYLHGMSEAEKLIKTHGRKEASYLICQSETNDCVVRAISTAFDVSYIDAHRFCEVKLHRNPRQGVYTNRYLTPITQAFGKKFKKLGKKRDHMKILTRPMKHKTTKWSNAKQKMINTRVVKQVQYKVCEFLKEYSEGSYVVTVKSHAFALVNGVIVGNWNDDRKLNRKVMSAWKVS